VSFPHISIEEVCVLVTDGTHYTPPDLGEGIPFLTVKDMTKTGLDLVGCSKISPEEFQRAYNGSCAPKVGDVLFSKDGTVGKVHVVKEKDSFAVLSSIAILRPNSNLIYSEYLGRVLETKQVLDQAVRKKTGSAIRRIILSDLKRVMIPLPPLEEQKRIATILDKADAIRKKRQESIEQCNELLKSTFLDMFGDPEKNNWDISSIDRIAESKKGSIRTGPFGSQLLHSEFTTDGIAVLGIDNAVENEFRWAQPRFISETKYNQLRRYTVIPGDVLITIMGTCGRCAIVPENCPTAINTKHLCCITLDKSKCLPSFLHSYFLYHPIAQRYLSRRAKGAIMDGLNMGIIKEMPIPQVPVGLQAKYKIIKDKISDVRKKMKVSLQEMDNNFNSLSQRAFRGKL